MHGGRRNTGHVPSTRSHTPFRVSNYFLFLCFYKWNLVQNTCLVTSAIHLIRNLPKEHPWAKPPTASPKETGQTWGLPNGWASRAACPSCVSVTHPFPSGNPGADVAPCPCAAGQNPKALSCPTFQMHCSLNSHVQPPGAVLSPSQQPHAPQKTRSKPGVMAP